MNSYNMAWSVCKGNEVKFGCTILFAHSFQEATGFTLEYMKKQYPFSEGYFSYETAGYEISDEWIVKLHKAMLERNK